MLKYLILLSSVVFTSCCGLHTEVYYTYKDITIKRIDKCGISSFYYANSQIKDAGRIWVKYSGINDGFSGYLKFDENKKVTILSGDGSFKNSNLDTTLFTYKRILAHERPQLGDSICFVTLATKYEKEYNDKKGTGVKVKYFIDENEWW